MKLLFVVLFLSAAFAYENEGKMTCNGCKTVVGVVENFMKANKTIEYIQEHVEQFCTLFKKTELENTCERIIEHGLPKIINYLEKKFPPERICAMIGACTDVPMVKLFAKKTESNIDDVVCEGCKIFVNAIHAWTSSDSMTTLIDSLFDKMCLLFKDTDFQPVCEDIVNYGVDKVIEFIQSELPAEKVCAFAKICPATENVNTVAETSKVNNNSKDHHIHRHHFHHFHGHHNHHFRHHFQHFHRFNGHHFHHSKDHHHFHHFNHTNGHHFNRTDVQPLNPEVPQYNFFNRTTSIVNKIAGTIANITSSFFGFNQNPVNQTEVHHFNRTEGHHLHHDNHSKGHHFHHFNHHFHHFHHANNDHHHFHHFNHANDHHHFHHFNHANDHHHFHHFNHTNGHHFNRADVQPLVVEVPQSSNHTSFFNNIVGRISRITSFFKSSSPIKQNEKKPQETKKNVVSDVRVLPLIPTPLKDSNFIVPTLAIDQKLRYSAPKEHSMGRHHRNNRRYRHHRHDRKGRHQRHNSELRHRHNIEEHHHRHNNFHHHRHNVQLHRHQRKL